jgi:hypothetical protein
MRYLDLAPPTPAPPTIDASLTSQGFVLTLGGQPELPMGPWGVTLTAQPYVPFPVPVAPVLDNNNPPWSRQAPGGYPTVWWFDPCWDRVWRWR